MIDDAAPACSHACVSPPSRIFRDILKKGAREFLLSQLRVRRAPLRYLFVLGHMRSGSSLLLHILGSHPEIRALGESWIHYDDPEKLTELLYFVHAGNRSLLVDERYVVDKILHNDLLQDAELLRMPAVTSVFLVRGAERTLKSLYFGRQRLRGISGWQSALEYYECRLEHLVALARSIGDPRRSALVSYERLVQQPGTTLDAVGTFLGLRSPLRERYRITPTTGMAGLGDFSEHIRSGRIAVTPAPETEPIPEEVLSRGRAAHDACVAAITAVGRSI